MKEILWKSFNVFISIFLLLWVVFYTYQPDFLKDDDFVGPGKNGRGGEGIKKESDKYLSDRGRTLIFLISIISGLAVGLIFFSFCYFFLNNKEKKNIKNYEQDIDLII